MPAALVDSKMQTFSIITPFVFESVLPHSLKLCCLTAWLLFHNSISVLDSELYIHGLVLRLSPVKFGLISTSYALARCGLFVDFAIDLVLRLSPVKFGLIPTSYALARCGLFVDFAIDLVLRFSPVKFGLLILSTLALHLRSAKSLDFSIAFVRSCPNAVQQQQRGSWFRSPWMTAFCLDLNCKSNYTKYKNNNKQNIKC